MSDFVSGLRAELVSAAERRERRRVVLRRPAPGRLVPALVAAAVIAALASAALIEWSPGRDERSAAPRRGPVTPLFGGTLQPGVRYGTRALVPAVTFAVADGRWAAIETDNSQFLGLLRQEPRPEGFGVQPEPRGLVTVGRLTEVYDPATPGLERSISEAPADIVAWLRAHPDIEAGRPRPARLAGLEGEILDMRFRFSRPAHAAPDCRFRDYRCTTLAPGDVHREGSIMRMWVLDFEPGPLLVTLEGLDERSFRELEAAARPVLDSLEVTRP